MENTEFEREAHGLLRRFFGYTSFRPGQLEVISALHSGRDALVLMPTGGGKSLCYQIPALLAREGVTVVVSPLIALMQDQTAALQANGIPAAALHSNQTETENIRIMDAAYQGKLKLLYISPERLLLMLPEWRNLKINLFAIDEAHCISQWGHDFRPDYAALSRLRELRPEVPIIALTATADRLTRNDISERLGLRDPFCHTGSFDRPNISLAAFNNPGLRERVKFVTMLTRKYPGDSGIAYCLSRSNAENFTKALQAAGVRAVCYHAGMSPADRDRSLKAFLNGAATVCCATVAFGMGIDKSNIRWVVHNNMPGNIESYYQEIGRAGRDGLPSEAILFHSYADMMTLEKFADESGRPEVNHEKLAQMRAYAEARICRRRILLNYFSQESISDCGNCDVCTNPPQRFDGTILAQKALSAVMRTGGRDISVNTLINILRGSMRADIVSAGYDRIKTFGAGADLSAAQWKDYITQMIQSGVFEIAYDDNSHLRVTELGMRILRGQQELELSVFVPFQPKEKKRSEAPVRAIVDPVTQLFEQLKNVRTLIARKEGVPPYIIFSDATLMEMATRHPATIEQLLEVSGVGERKAVRYGNKFLKEIRRFDGLGASRQSGTSLKETLILFNAGVPIGEIAQIKNVKLSTVYTHLAELIDADMISTYGSFLSRSDYQTITAEYASNPEGAFERLKERYDGGIIRIALAVSRANSRRTSQS